MANGLSLLQPVIFHARHLGSACTSRTDATARASRCVPPESTCCACLPASPSRAGRPPPDRAGCVVTMVALRELQRCVTIDVTVSSTQSVIRCAPISSSTRISASKRGAISFLVHGSRRLIVAAADVVEQPLEIEEEALESACDQAAQRRHGQMSFARSRRTQEQEPGLGNPRILAHITANIHQHLGERRSRDGILRGQNEIVH